MLLLQRSPVWSLVNMLGGSQSLLTLIPGYMTPIFWPLQVFALIYTNTHTRRHITKNQNKPLRIFLGCINAAVIWGREYGLFLAFEL